MSRPSDRALLVLAVGVTLGCIGLGAPPRMEPVEGATPILATFLEALGPAAVVRAAVGIALAIVLASGLIRGRRDPSVGRTWPLLAVAAMGLLALVPLPAAVIGLVSPYVAETWDNLAAGGLDLTRTLSVWPAGTQDALWNVAGMVAATAAVFAACRGSDGGESTGRGLDRAIRVLAFVAAVGALECAYGIATTHLGDDTILGLAKVSGKGRVTGTFVLAPMLGVWAGMGACAATGLLLLEWTREAGRRRAVLALAAAAMVVCGVGGVLSLARLMLAAVAAGLLVTWWLAGGVMARDGRTTAGRLLRGAALLAPVAGIAAALLVPALRERVDFILPYLRGEAGPVEPRFAGWASTWELFTRAPLFGTGLGSFGRAIHLAQSVDAPDEMWFTHCEPLNLLSDIGVVGTAVVFAWIATTLAAGRAALLAADPRRALVAAAAYGAAAVVLVAGLADFQTQFPVVAIPFAALLTLPAALATTSATDERRVQPAVATAVGGLLLALAVGGFVARHRHVDAGLRPGATRGERYLERARTAMSALAESKNPADDLIAVRDDLRRATETDPLHDAAHTWRAVADLAARSLTFDADESDALRDAVLASLGRARWVSRGHADANLQVGLLYLDLLGTVTAPYGPPGDDALAALREAGAIVPQAFSRAWREALARDLPPEDLERLVPDRPHAQRVWASHLRTLGRIDEADAILRGLDPEAPSDR